MGDLKALPATSEAQLASDLQRRPSFIRPFMLACASRNAKFAVVAVSCLQRLVTSQGLSTERLTDVLGAFTEAISQNVEVQLKVLQALPPMLQNYTDYLGGEAIGKMLLIASELQASRSGVVHGTAAAALQQLVVAMYEKITAEDDASSDGFVEEKIQTPSGEVQVRSAALDVYKIFEDICLLTRGHKPQYLRLKSIPQITGLELIEAVLRNHHSIFDSHPEQVDILHRHVMPLITKILVERSDFPPSVRAVRVFSLILRSRNANLTSSCGEVLDALTRLLENDSLSMWRRALALEAWRAIYADFGLLRELYSGYDRQEGTIDVVRNNLAKQARLAAERPDVIGLGQHSSVAGEQPGSKDQLSEQFAMEAGGVGGIITGAVNLRSAEAQGISVQSSSIRVACMDQLDKSDPPTLPDAYIYSLVLMCIGDFADGLAKFILPLTVAGARRHQRKSRKLTVSENGASGRPPTDTQSSAVKNGRDSRATLPTYETSAPINPLTLRQSSQYPDIETAVAMIEDCWPAALAACSTFLYATLDHTFFRSLVRSFQKLTHVSGLVRLKTPRDAFLTTLSKAAVPQYHISSSHPSTPTTPGPKEGPSSADSHSFFSPLRHVRNLSNLSTDDLRESPSPATPPSLSIRNLLCLRGLLNVGIALAPILDHAWSIIIEAWQQARFLIQLSLKPTTARSTPGSNQSSDAQNSSGSAAQSSEFQAELSAIEAAGSRLLESTDELPNEAFVDLLKALSKALNQASLRTDGSRSPAPSPNRASQVAQSPPEGTPIRPKSPGAHALAPSLMHSGHFNLQIIGSLMRINLERLVVLDASETGLKMLVERLVWWTCSPVVDSSLRLKSAEILNAFVRDAATSRMQHLELALVDGQPVFMYPLYNMIQALQEQPKEDPMGLGKIDLGIQRSALESLKVVLEHRGEVLDTGWEGVFAVVASVFEPTRTARHDPMKRKELKKTPEVPPAAIFSYLMRPAFGSVQLICSDFLPCLPNSCILALIDALFEFCNQQDDLNIALTSITLFWQLSSFLHNRSETKSSDGEGAPEENEVVLRRQAVGTQSYQANMALWMILLHRLTVLGVDRRPDIRNGVIQSIFRVFDGYGDQLSQAEWQSCLQSVVLTLIERNIEQKNSLPSSSAQDFASKAASWDETTISIIHGVAELFSSYAHIFLAAQDLKESWAAIVQYFAQVLDQGRLGLTTVVFRSIRQMLGSVESAGQLDTSLLDSIWSLWLSGLPAKSDTMSTSAQENQDALLAYIQAFKEIHRLTRHSLTDERTTLIIESLHSCIVAPNSSTTAGLETMTPLQTKILETIKLIRRDIPAVPILLIGWLSKVIGLPFDQGALEDGNRPRKYVALAIKSMEYMQSTVLEYIRNENLYISGAFAGTIGSLARCISHDSLTRGQVKDDTLRTTAIGSALVLLSSAITRIHDIGLDEQDIRDVWNRFIIVARSILRPGRSPRRLHFDGPSQDDYDVLAFSRLRDLVSPGMGCSIIRDETRRAYCEILFRSSVIHQLDEGELLDSGERILEDLYEIRMGRTSNPAPNPRIKLCYVCLDELFTLVAKGDGSPERVRLAQAASPFLILRVALPLRDHIADQPLRGRMPQPAPQRRELLYILRALISLECESRAIPDAPGVTSKHKKHLHRIFPFIGQAMRVARQDQELLSELSKVAEMVADEMGILS